MAVVTETLAELADSGYMAGTELRFKVFSGVGPNGEDLSGATSIAEMIFVQARVPVSRDDGRSVEPMVSKWVLFSDAEITGGTGTAGLNMGDAANARPILKRVFDWIRDNLLI